MDKRPVETTLYSLAQMAPERPRRRQRSDGQLSLLRVGTLMIGERRELCLIKNVSVGGMLIRAYCEIRPGTRLSIELKQSEAVSGTAQWTKDDCVGVSFDEPIDVLSLISCPEDGQKPRMPRVEIDCAAWVREGATVHRTRAANISQGGLKTLTPNRLKIDAEVIVSLNGLPPISGTVRWKDGDAYGIAFNDVLSLPRLVAWLQQQQQQGERTRAAGGSLA